jgi:hypothetical protein
MIEDGGDRLAEVGVMGSNPSAPGQRQFLQCAIRITVWAQ